MSTANVIELHPSAARESRPEWMTPEEVSAYLKVSLETLQDWRRSGRARVLPFHTIGRLVRYERGEIDAALDAGRVEVKA